MFEIERMPHPYPCEWQIVAGAAHPTLQPGEIVEVGFETPEEAQTWIAALAAELEAAPPPEPPSSAPT